MESFAKKEYKKVLWFGNVVFGRKKLFQFQANVGLRFFRFDDVRVVGVIHDCLFSHVCIRIVGSVRRFRFNTASTLY